MTAPLTPEPRRVRGPDRGPRTPRPSCNRGHPFTAENTYVSPSRTRSCRACARAKTARYRAIARAARPVPTPTDEIKEFWALVDRNGPMCTALGTRCWEWQGRRLNAGYGQVRLSGKTLLTHRIAWEIEVGLIPDGLQVLHHCDNPPCCRPDHLWTGTQLENMRDALRKGRLRNGNKGRTHCVRGHEFTPENTYVVPCGKRQCRACVRVTSGRWRKANRTYRYGEKDRARAARYYQRHREKILDRQREYDRQNSVALLARRRARRAKRAA